MRSSLEPSGPNEFGYSAISRSTREKVAPVAELLRTGDGGVAVPQKDGHREKGSSWSRHSLCRSLPSGGGGSRGSPLFSLPLGPPPASPRPRRQRVRARRLPLPPALPT